MNDPVVGRCLLSTIRSFLRPGVEPGGVGSSGVLAHCWALRNQSRRVPCDGGGGGAVLLGASADRSAPEGGWPWWVCCL
jgi:hypothetical protein